MKPESSEFTYRNGKKIHLRKSANEFVVRTDKTNLDKMGYTKTERTSPSSFRVKVAKRKLDETMDKVRKKMVAHHAYYTPETGQEFLITDRIFVGFKKAISKAGLAQFKAKYALTEKEKYSNKEFLFEITTRTGMNPNKLIVLLNENEDSVDYAENDLNMRAQKYSIQLPVDFYYERQWHLHTHFRNKQYDPRCSTRCEQAWLLLESFGSNKVVVGITDDGCKLNHPDFDSAKKFAAWGYMRKSELITNTASNADTNQMYQTGCDHGTSCAGVIGGEVDGNLIVGAAPGCKLLPIKWESSGQDLEALEINESKFIKVLDFISDKVDILSNSWGFVPDSSWRERIVDKIKYLALNGGRRGKGIIFLWAAGNENCPINYSGNIKIPYTNGGKTRTGKWIHVRKSKIFQNNLVGIPGVMHIAAISSMAQRSHYSNYGPGIDLCAPADNIHAYNRMSVKGLGISTATAEKESGYTSQFGGTSGATPLVAGVAALVISANRLLKSTDVIAILKQTASRDLNMQGYKRTRGAPYDKDTSWDVSPVPPFDKGNFNTKDTEGKWSPWFGYGKVDAYEAVKKALALRTNPRK